MDYIFTPKDIYLLIKQADKRNLLGVILLAGLSVGFRIWLGISFEALALAALLFATAFWNLNSRIIIVIALFYLALIPLLLLLPDTKFPIAQVWARKSAIWAFYCLAIGVGKQLFEYIVEARLSVHRRIQRPVQIITTIIKQHATFLGHQTAQPKAPTAPPVVAPNAEPLVTEAQPTIAKSKTKHKTNMDGIVLKRRTIIPHT